MRSTSKKSDLQIWNFFRQESKRSKLNSYRAPLKSHVTKVWIQTKVSVATIKMTNEDRIQSFCGTSSREEVKVRYVWTIKNVQAEIEYLKAELEEEDSCIAYLEKNL